MVKIQTSPVFKSIKLINRATISFPRIRFPYLIPLIYVILFYITLRTYLLWQSGNFLLGLVALPMVIQFERINKQYFRYGWLALLFALLSCLLPIKTLFYFAGICAVFYLVESFYGRLNHLPFFVAIFMSPVFQYFSNIFSFPIRLQLTEWAGKLFSLMGMELAVEGNIIHYRGNEFSVDPACMGINMTVTSLLLGLMIIAFYQKRSGKRINIVWTSGLLLLILGLNIFSNLIRIICLVQFNILPDTLAHELTGVFCLLLYVVVPSAFFIKQVINRMGKPAPAANLSVHSVIDRKHYIFHSIILIIFFWASILISQNDKYEAMTIGPAPSVKGYNSTRIDWSIVKLENDQSLVYIKSIRDFYYADHNPMICWRGSGYELRQVKTVEIGTDKVYCAMLEKDKEKLYTAWWYDNGNDKTIDQFKWRWNVLKGDSKYSLINITAAKQVLLEEEIKKVRGDNRFKSLL